MGKVSGEFKRLRKIDPKIEGKIVGIYILLYFSFIINTSSALSTSSNPFLHFLPNGILINTITSKIITTNTSTQARFYINPR